MLFNDLKITAELLKSGGLNQALSDYSNEDIENLNRLESLELIKADILLELGINTIDYDAVMVNYGALMYSALYNLQRINILIELADNFSGLSEDLIKNHQKEYDRIKNKFKTINLFESFADTKISTNYL